MAYHDWDELEANGIYDLSDALTEEDLEQMEKARENHKNQPISMESLGLTWRDFF